MQRNIVITAGATAQDVLPARLGRTSIIVNPLDEDCWLAIGSTAAVDAGEYVYQGSPTKFTVEEYPEIGGRVSIFSATTNSRITIREV